MSIRCVVAVARSDERAEGPEDASVVVTVPLVVASEDGFSATVEYMRGRLKAKGHTGELLDALADGTIDDMVRRLVSG
ncbi:MAG: hypothetical protein EBS10_00940 [Acidimicrobiia bacterium]|jgi:hypothetical protein|nr:hypothetical protein [Acidimicrobiia bacterium]